MFVDYSAFASVGVEPEPAWGGVVRASTSRIVNIQGGGGVLPLLRRDGLGARSGARSGSGIRDRPVAVGDAGPRPELRYESPHRAALVPSGDVQMAWEFDGRQAARGGDLSDTGRGGFALPGS